MEDFNIAEALKYAPKGLKLYSPVLGEVEISEVSQGTYAIEVKISGKSYSFTEHGRYLEGKGECLLFPSKDHRTWDNWQDLLLPQSIGCVCAYTGTIPQPTMFLCTSNRTVFSDNTGNTWDVLIGHSGNYLKSSRYATPEESKQFFDELKANGYEWDGKNVVKTTPASPFKVGDWVVNKLGEVWHIDSVDKINYQVSNEKGCHNYFPISEQDEMRLWTIKDAKDGDVLVSPATQEGDKECPFIFKEIDKNGIVRFYAALLQSEELKIADGITNVMGYANAGYHIPATKEQRDLLFQKIKETGYTWDVEKKELRKLQSDKFDVSTLQPFDKVLVRDSKDDKWHPNIFSFYLSDTNIDFRFSTITDSWRYCIPYNDDTKHLVGTTNDVPEFYKTW